MVEGFDVGFSIRETVQRMSGKKNVDLVLVSDSKSLYGLVVSLSQTTERRLQIDLEMLREAYENRDLTSVGWIPGEENPSDDLTKPEKRNGSLAKLIQSNKFDPQCVSWIKRDKSPINTSMPEYEWSNIQDIVQESSQGL